MATKDLNLSLDQSLAPGELSHAAKQKPAFGGEPQQLQSGDRKTAFATSSRRNFAAITISLVVIVNMAFLLLAGIWISTFPGSHAQTNTPSVADATAVVELKIAETNSRLDLLQQQVHELIELIKTQQQFAEASGKVSAEEEPIIKSGADIIDFTNESTNPVDNWYINLGTFDTEKLASSAQKQLLAMGQQPDIQRTEQVSSTTFELVISGFSDRESAELAAGYIMENSDLNGLSIWKENQ